YLVFRITGNGKWQTAKFELSRMAGAETWYQGTVDYIIIKPVGLNKWVEIDQVKLLVDAVTDLPGRDVVLDRDVETFNGFADSAELQSAWSPYNAAVTLETVDGGNKSMKVVNQGDGAQAQAEVTADKDWSDYQSLELTY